MNLHWKRGEYHPSPLLRAVQIFLLVLIIIGVILLATQAMWVPKVVDYILKSQGYQTPPVIILNTPTPSPLPTASPTSFPKPSASPTATDSGVLGLVTIGPTCPVMHYPDDGTCADKPYQTTLVIQSNLPGRGGGILVTSDATGHYSHDLSAGTYTIRSQSEAVMPRLSPVTFTIVAHKRTVVNLQFDSGIR